MVPERKNPRVPRNPQERGFLPGVSTEQNVHFDRRSQNEGGERSETKKRMIIDRKTLN